MRVGILVLLACLLSAPQVRAVPAFAAQTGQPCQSCHVGGFGPQLTPYGRNFKLNGYTQRSGGFTVPLAVAATASYLHTAKAAPGPAAPGFAANDNFALDQINLFLAGGLGQHLGGFVQTTWDGVAKAWSWDNLDLRAVASTRVAGKPVVMGLSLNNSPGVEDAWNTLPAWGFPYTRSALAPGGPTAPLLDGGLAQHALGLTGYAWIDQQVYVEAGGYVSPGARWLTRLGSDPTAPGTLDGTAFWGRAAWQKAFGSRTVEFGAFGLAAAVFPGDDRTTGTSDLYRDVGLDASFYAPLRSGDVVTLNARYMHENQTLRASTALGLAANRHGTLSELSIEAAYYWRNRIGLTIQAFDVSGSADPLLYAGTRKFKPDTSGLTFQIDATPFGAASQPRRRLNMRIGVQYTLFTRFSGAAVNFDGLGGRASDEDTARVFTWFAF